MFIFFTTTGIFLVTFFYFSYFWCIFEGWTLNLGFFNFFLFFIKFCIVLVVFSDDFYDPKMDL